MNRIYQGRVSSIQILDVTGTFRPVPLGSSESCVLRQHHRTFQDAVNYYLAALGSLADSSCRRNRSQLTAGYQSQLNQ